MNSLLAIIVGWIVGWTLGGLFVYWLQVWSPWATAPELRKRKRGPPRQLDGSFKGCTCSECEYARGHA